MPSVAAFDLAAALIAGPAGGSTNRLSDDVLSPNRSSAALNLSLYCFLHHFHHSRAVALLLNVGPCQDATHDNCTCALSCCDNPSREGCGGARYTSASSYSVYTMLLFSLRAAALCLLKTLRARVRWGEGGGVGERKSIGPSGHRGSRAQAGILGGKTGYSNLHA